jgi:hypothetical protein
MYKFSPEELDLLNSTDYASKEIHDQILILITKIFKNKVHFCDPVSKVELYAPIIIEVKEVEMLWDQTVDYLRHKRQEFEIGTISIGGSQRNSYHTAQKRFSNSNVTGTKSPKFELIVADTLAVLKTTIPIKQQCIYSNFLGNGIKPIYKAIDDLGYKVTLATGENSTREKNESFQKYNTKEANVLTMSSVGGLGLTFKNTDILRFADAFENEAMESQCIHRFSRIGARDDQKKGDPIPPVLVVKYVSIFPKAYTPEQSRATCDYFYKNYCDKKWGTKQELFNCPEEKFIDLLIEKIVKEEESETIDQKLLKSNQIKEQTLTPLKAKIAELGTLRK